MNDPWQQKVEQNKLIGDLSKKQKVLFASECIRNMFEVMQEYLRENVNAEIISQLQIILDAVGASKKSRADFSAWKRFLLRISQDESLDEVLGFDHVISAVGDLLDLIEGTPETTVLCVAENSLNAVNALDDIQNPLVLPDDKTLTELMRSALENPDEPLIEVKFPLTDKHVEFQARMLEKLADDG